MKIIDLIQGSQEWLDHRRNTRNASEAPALMGVSPYMTRAQLIRKAATGIEQDIDAATQRRFDKGHQVEPALRLIAEVEIDDEFYPVTAVSDDEYLGASFDGVTLSGDTICEAKQFNAEKVESIRFGKIPQADYWQVVQQFAVNEAATTCLYVVGDGSQANTHILTIHRDAVEADVPKLIAAWQQFDKDVAAYQPEQAVEAVSGEAPQSLPAIRLELTGMVTASNLPEFKEKALAVFQSINQDLVTDQDFANAEEAVKFCGDIESKIEAAKQHALSQTASIDELFRVLDEIKETARRKRLDLDKLVKTRKESRKAELVTAAIAAVREHEAGLNKTLGAYGMPSQPTLPSVCAEAIKGKRSFSAMKDALDTVVAQQKIAANAEAELIRANATLFQEALAEHGELFPDHVQLVLSKDSDDLSNLIELRVAEKKRKDVERQQADEAARAADAAKPASSDPIVAILGGCAVSKVFIGENQVIPPVVESKLIKLGKLNDLIAPLKIDADGLAKLGFHPDANERAAKLYEASKLPAIWEAMKAVIISAAAKAV